MASELALIDRLCNIHLDLEQVDGTLATIIDLGNEKASNQPSPKQFLRMLQLLDDIVSPSCEKLEAIIQELDARDSAPTPAQGQ
jgi:hypothetical protein